MRKILSEKVTFEWKHELWWTVQKNGRKSEVLGAEVREGGWVQVTENLTRPGEFAGEKMESP